MSLVPGPSSSGFFILNFSFEALLAKVVERFEKQMRDDKKLRKRIEKVAGQMSNVKGRP